AVTPAARPSLPAPPAAHVRITVPQARANDLAPRAGAGRPAPARSMSVPGRPAPSAPRFSIDPGRVAFVGSRTFPHFIVYPAGGVYPVFYASYPWAAQAYDVPTLSGLAVDEGFLEPHLNPPDAALVVDGVELGGPPEEGALLPVRPGYHT